MAEVIFTGPTPAAPQRDAFADFAQAAGSFGKGLGDFRQARQKKQRKQSYIDLYAKFVTEGKDPNAPEQLVQLFEFVDDPREAQRLAAEAQNAIRELDIKQQQVDASTTSAGAAVTSADASAVRAATDQNVQAAKEQQRQQVGEALSAARERVASGGSSVPPAGSDPLVSGLEGDLALERAAAEELEARGLVVEAEKRRDNARETAKAIEAIRNNKADANRFLSTVNSETAERGPVIDTQAPDFAERVAAAAQDGFTPANKLSQSLGEPGTFEFDEMRNAKGETLLRVFNSTTKTFSFIDPKTGDVVEDPNLAGFVPSGRQPTAAEAKLATRVAVMRASETQFATIEAGGFDPTTLGAGVRGKLFKLPLLGSFLTNAEVEQYEVAKLNFLNAVARDDSGATIKDDELGRYVLSLFPAPFDDPPTLRLKRTNRLILISAFQQSAGIAHNPELFDMAADLFEELGLRPLTKAEAEGAGAGVSGAGPADAETSDGVPQPIALTDVVEEDSQAAVSLLLEDPSPEARAEFDAIFGEGSANRVLLAKGTPQVPTGP